MIKHDHPEMLNAYEVILHPPPFRLLGGKLDKAGKCWLGEAYFETPKGPVHVVTKVELPDAAMSLMRMVADHLIVKKAAEKLGEKLASSGAFSPGDFNAAGLWDYGSAGCGDDGAGWGISFPNPLKVIQKAAGHITRQVRSAANLALSQLPAPLRAVAVGPLQLVARATNAIGLQAAVAQAVNVLGSTKIPGTGISIAALNPAGAAVLYGAKVIGPEATKAILGDDAPDLAESLMNAGAIPVLGKTLVQQKARAQALKLREDANFARDVGIPTLQIDPLLRPAARQVIDMLRGAYIKEPKATAALTKLRDLAGSGNKDARMLWALAANISDSAWALHRGGGRKSGGVVSAGDGLGEGYGKAGFAPPENPARMMSAGEAGNRQILDLTLANGVGGPVWGA